MKKLLAALLALLLLTGCQQKKTQAEITLPEPEPPIAEETTPESEPPVTAEMPTEPVQTQLEEQPEPQKWPTPSSSMFGLTGREAALYDAAVSQKYPREDSDIVLPSLRVRGSFEEDGKTVVICDLHYDFYYDYIGSDWTWNSGGATTYLRAELETQDGAEVCTGFVEYPSGSLSDWIRDYCGKLAEQNADGAWVLPETTNNWFPSDGDMLRQYLDAAEAVQEPSDGFLRDEALREKFTPDASQVTDEDLLEIFRGIELALVGHGNDFFDDPRALSSEQLYALFLRWTHYDALKPYQDPDSGYYSIPREAIERTLACYLDRYNFDITQCPGYDAESDTVVDRMPKDYGGDPNVKMASRTMDGNTLTCVVDFYPMEYVPPEEEKPISCNEYVLTCYEGGFYLESIRRVPLESK